MKKQNTYDALQELKAVGLTRHQASIHLGIDYRTACKYWDMTPDQFQQTLSESQSSFAINIYRDEIVDCLKKYPEMSAAQMKAWICMKRDVDSLDIADRTFQKCVNILRKEYNIPKIACSQNTTADINAPENRESVLNRLAEKKSISKNQISGETHKGKHINHSL